MTTLPSSDLEVRAAVKQPVAEGLSTDRAERFAGACTAPSFSSNRELVKN